MQNENQASEKIFTRESRIAWLDRARGSAVLAMILYHCAWDLHHFVWHTNYPNWVWRLGSIPIATAFLFIAGYSCGLEQARLSATTFAKKIHAKATRVILAALLVSAVSLSVQFARPIYFGILHCIGISYLCVFFLAKRSNRMILSTAALTLISGIALDWFPPRQRVLFWLMDSSSLATGDHYPLLPWLGVVLLGFVAGRKLRTRAAGAKNSRATRSQFLVFAGRHSLLIYLLHQPLLIALLKLAGVA